MAPDADAIRTATGSVRSYSPCRIGLWGQFDLDDYGAMLPAIVARRELRRRLPEADIRFFSPYGHLRPGRLDGGEPVEPLGCWEEDRLLQLRRELDCVLIGGEIVKDDAKLASDYGVGLDQMASLGASRFFIEAFGDDPGQHCPVMWSAVGVPAEPGPDLAERLRGALARRPYATVRDEASRRRLEQCGVERDIVVVPDPAVLLGRIFAAEVLSKRTAYLRLMGWFPRADLAVFVQGNCHFVEKAPALAEALRLLLEERQGVTVVLAQLGDSRGDAEFSAAVAGGLPPERIHRLPAAVSLEDVAAAISASAVFVGSSVPGCVTALCYGRPGVLLQGASGGNSEGLESVGTLTRLAVADTRAWGARTLSDLVRSAVDGTTGVVDAALAPLQAAADSHFDLLAQFADDAFGERSVTGERPDATGKARVSQLESELAALRTAHKVRGERLFAERVMLADLVSDHQRELRRSEEIAHRMWSQLDAEVPRRIAAESELEAIRDTKLFKWSASARAVYRLLMRAGR